VIADEVLARPIHIGPRRMCHVNLFVGALQRSIDFYTQVCGIELATLEPPIKAAFFSNGNSHHDLGMLEVTQQTVVGEGGHRILGDGAAADTGLYHLGWEMPNEFELVKAYQRASAAGFKVNRTSSHRSSNSVYTSDADGRIHEFYADVILDWRHAGPPKSGQWDPFSRPPILEPRYEVSPEVRKVPGAAMQPVRFSHAVLVARDMERQRRFLTNVAGLYELPHRRNASFAAFATPACRYPFAIALVAESLAAADSRRGLHHFSLEVAGESALDAAAERLAASGAKVEREFDLAHKRSVIVRDPDGVAVEFVYPRGGALDLDALPGNAETGFLL
jgi:catechol 2,3-dioxygenase